MHIPQKPTLPASKIKCATHGNPVMNATILKAFTSGSNRINLFLKVTARSKNISEDKKLPTIMAP